MLAIIGVRKMIDGRKQRAKLLAIVAKPPDRHAAEADPVIAPFATDQPYALRLSFCIPVGECNLERGVGGFRSGIAEKHMIEIARRQRRHAAGQFERARMPELEGWRKVELGRLL